MTNTVQDITILGAGIGGLTAAIALARNGARVRVLEQAAALTEVGAGIQISQNGMAVLKALDIVGDRPDTAVQSAGVQLRDYRHGRLIFDLPGPSAGPTWYFHRADLLTLLDRAAIRAGVEIQLGQKIEALAKHGAEVVLTSVSGDLFKTTCLIGADGVRGVSRPFVTGSQHAQFSGQVAWRAVVPWTDMSAPPSAVVTMAPGQHIVTYPLRGQTAMNIVAVEERTGWSEESWRQPGDPAELRRRFCGFGGHIAEILDRVETVHLWALHLHPVAPRWHDGPVVLLGDAAHPTLPFMAQGACLALEDAWVLANAVVQAKDTATGFARYQSQRQARARRVVKAAEGNATRFHLRSPLRELAQIGLGVAGRFIAPKYDWIYGHDVTRISD